MRTEDLIRALSQGANRRPPLWGGPAMLAVVIFGVALATVVAIYLGLRGDVQMLAPGRATLLKVIGASAVSLAAASAALRLSQPGTDVTGRIMAAAALLALIALVALQSGTPSSLRFGGGETTLRLVLLALPGLAACLFVLRRRASMNPMLTGAAAGLVSAGAAAIGYALHCPAETSGFIARWYGLAALVMAGLGAALGRRVLAW